MKRVRSSAVAVTSALLTVSLAACLGTPLPRSAPPLESRSASASKYFGAAHIHDTEATTAWDALRLLAPHVRLVEPHPWGVRREPTTAGSGQSGAPAARLILNGFSEADPTVLRAIPASTVIDIEVLGAMEATMRMGVGYGGGAVVVRTVQQTTS